MSRLSSVTESRPLDAYYDPIYQSPFQQNSFASLRKPSIPHETSQVAGSERFKYFKRPVVPVLDALPAEIILAPTAAGDPLIPPPAPVEPPTKEFAMQTDYRESEAQTDPYTPAYILPEGCPDPELLLLQKLTFAKGLQPVTMLEVQHIEFQRRKHLIESSLPPATDEASLKLRKRILENLEMQSFKLREAEIDRNREAKLAVLERVLHERDEAQEYADEQRVEATRQDLLAKRDLAVERIQAHRLQVLRKLSKERNGYQLPGEARARDIITDYASLSSKVYAQVTRDGTVSDQHLKTWIDHNAGAPAHKLRSLEVLHKSLPDHLFNVDVARALQHHHDTPAKGRAAGAARGKAQSLAMNLELMDWVLRRQKAGDNMAGTTAATTTTTGRTAAGSSPGPAGRPPPVLTGPAALQHKASSVEEPVSPSWKSAKKAVERPSTPTVPDLTPEEALEPYVLLLQRLLRGRAVQNVMYEGKERRKELIKELRLQEKEEAEEAVSEEEAKRVAAAERRQQVVETTLDTIAGAVASHMLEARTVDPNKPPPPADDANSGSGGSAQSSPGSLGVADEGGEGETEEERERRREEAKVAGASEPVEGKQQEAAEEEENKGEPPAEPTAAPAQGGVEEAK